MNMHRIQRISMNALMAMILVLPVFAAITPVGATEVGINDEVEERIEEVYGPDFPQGQWVTKKEWATFYMHTEAGPGSVDEALGGDPGTSYLPPGTETSNNNHLWLDTQRPLTQTSLDSPTQEPRIVVKDETVFSDGHAATFNWLGWHEARNEPKGKLGDFYNMSVYGMEVNVYGEYNGNTAQRFLADLWVHNATTGERIERIVSGLSLAPTTTGNIGDPVLFTGLAHVDNLDGYFIGHDRALAVDVYVPHTIVTSLEDNQGTILLDTNSAPSHVNLLTDSVRLNWWSEDRFGDNVDTYPSGQVQQTEDTRVRFKLLHHNLWGNEDDGSYRTDVAGAFVVTGHPRDWCNGDNDQADHCKYDNINQREYELRFRNLDTGQLMQVDLGKGLSGEDPGQSDTRVQCCNNDFRLIDYTNIWLADPRPSSDTIGIDGVALFEYEFAYNASFPDGAYAVEFRDDDPVNLNWDEDHIVHIGGVGFDLVPAPEEERFLTYEVDPDTDEIIEPRELVEVNHTVGVGERTDYQFELHNLGTTTDTFSLAVPVPGGGWQASVSPTQVSISEGEKADVTVTVKPSDTAVTGDWRAIHLVASSLRGDEEVRMRINTTLTSQITNALEVEERGFPIPLLYTEEEIIEANPGQPKKVPVGVQNLGTHADTFVITADGLPLGWIVDISPSYVTAHSKSVQDFVVTVTPPPEAQGGDAHMLVLRATRIANSGDFDELIIPVQVIIRDGLEVEVLDGTDRVWRDINERIYRCETTQEATNCEVEQVVEVRDGRYDESTIYRILVRNTGDREDTFTLSSSWNPDVGSDMGGCEEDMSDGDNASPGYTNGVPDGWRYSLLATPGVDSEYPTMPNVAQTGPTQANNPDNGYRRTRGTSSFSGDVRAGEVTLGPHEETELFVEMGWRNYPAPDPQDACDGEELADHRLALVLVMNNPGATWRAEEPSTEAELRMTIRSSNDPTERAVLPLFADITTSKDVEIRQNGRSPDALNSVAIEPQLGQDHRQLFEQDDVSTFSLRAVNKGNEHDDLIISISQEVPGWSHEITNWRYLGSRVSTEGESNNPRECVHPTPDTQPDRMTYVCSNVGVYDEVYFDVVSTPPADARIGDRDQVKVTVSGGTAQFRQVSQSIRLESIVSGPFAFEVGELDDDVEIAPDDSAALPFTISNIGMVNDEYEIKVVDAPADWGHRLSSERFVAVPSGIQHHGYLMVTAPEDVDAGDKETFRLQVRCVRCPPTVADSTQEFVVNANVQTPGQSHMSSEPRTILPDTVAAFNVTLRDIDEVPTWSFTIDPESLPDGYRLVCDPEGTTTPAGCQDPYNDPTLDVRQPSESEDAGGDPVREAEATFFLEVPPDQLATSRLAVRVFANNTDGDSVIWHDVELNLRSIYGVGIDTVPVSVADGGNVGVVAPGQTYVHRFEVKNPGLSPQQIRLTSSQLPTGWDLTFTTQESLYLRPGESREMEVAMSAPVTAVTGQEAVVRLTATVEQDTTKQASLALITRIGHYTVNLTATNETRFLAPHEEARFDVDVGNDGNVPDTIDVELTLPAAYRDRALVTWTGCSGPDRTVVPAPAGSEGSDRCRFIALGPEEGGRVSAKVTLGGDPLPGGTLVPITVTAKSALAPAPDPSLCPDQDLSKCPDVNEPIVTRTVRMQYLGFRAHDVDGDGVLEYAIDRDQDSANGFEEFRESVGSEDGVGIRTQVPDLARFLTDEARKDKTVKVTEETDDGTRTRDVLRYVIDGDDDGRTDHFLDINGDGLPDAYWDPDLGHVAQIEVVRDITTDGVGELFLDLDGDRRLDVYFDLTTGEFGALIQQFIDDDDDIDYIVDLNGNGQGDDNEPILFGGESGIVRTMLRRDVDGDGRLDQVFDLNGDGIPEYFIPAGSTKQFPIKAEDHNGNGQLEWGFDANEDGRVDSYYDPAADSSHLVDTRSDFFRSLQQFWYIAVIFAVVLVLFIVLVAVTRR